MPRTDLRDAVILDPTITEPCCDQPYRGSFAGGLPAPPSRSKLQPPPHTLQHRRSCRRQSSAHVDRDRNRSDWRRPQIAGTAIYLRVLRGVLFVRRRRRRRRSRVERFPPTLDSVAKSRCGLRFAFANGIPSSRVGRATPALRATIKMDFYRQLLDDRRNS